METSGLGPPGDGRWWRLGKFAELPSLLESLD